MKVFRILSACFFSIFAFACHKPQTCTCTNPGGTEEVFTKRCSKEKAEKDCKKYYDDNFGDISMSETNCCIK